MACLRGIQSALNKILCLFALNKLDTGLNPGASNLFLRGEPTLLAENLSDIELCLEREDRLRLMNGVFMDSAFVVLNWLAKPTIRHRHLLLLYLHWHILRLNLPFLPFQLL